jgi:hypothetical protein
MTKAKRARYRAGFRAPGGRIQCIPQVVLKVSFPAPVLRGFLPSKTRPRRWSITISLRTSAMFFLLRFNSHV